MLTAYHLFQTVGPVNHQSSGSVRLLLLLAISWCLSLTGKLGSSVHRARPTSKSQCHLVHSTLYLCSRTPSAQHRGQPLPGAHGHHSVQVPVPLVGNSVSVLPRMPVLPWKAQITVYPAPSKAGASPRSRFTGSSHNNKSLCPQILQPAALYRGTPSQRYQGRILLEGQPLTV